MLRALLQDVITLVVDVNIFLLYSTSYSYGKLLICIKRNLLGLIYCTQKERSVVWKGTGLLDQLYASIGISFQLNVE